MANRLYNHWMSDRHNGELSRKEELVEVSVFLFLILPSMLLSFFVIKQGNLSFILVAFAAILRDLALVSLILFFIWHNREPIDGLGWKSRNAGQEIVLGMGLYIPFFVFVGLFESALKMAGFSSPSTPLPSFMTARGLGESLLAVVLVAVVALTEETIFRGYLILRLKAITSSPTVAALLSAAIFSLGHGYEGSAGVLTVGVMGFIFAFIYLWRQSLLAPIVMHFLQDFIGIVLLPWLGKG